MYQIEEIKKRVLYCRKCLELVESRNKIAFSYGSGSNRIMLIGEAPSQVGGNLTGIPFSSKKSGQLIQDILKENNINREECYITNMIFCSPLANRKPTKEEIRTCYYNYKKDELKIIKPKLVILIGKTASNYFLPIGYNTYKTNSCLLVSVEHPSYILRFNNQEKVTQYKLKFKKIFDEFKTI